MQMAIKPHVPASCRVPHHDDAVRLQPCLAAVEQRNGVICSSSGNSQACSNSSSV
jgi:hypothetical protein